MNPFAALALAIAKRVALDILRSIAQAAYDRAWDEIYRAVEKAEDAWRGFGSSEIKKAWVLEQIIAQIKSARKDRPLTARQEKRLRYFMGWWIDQFVGMLNKSFGKSWRSQIESLRVKLGKDIPFVD